MNSKIYKIGFFILLATNIVLVSFIVTKPKRSFKREDMREKMSKELGLSKEQKTLFMEMAMVHRERIRELDAEESELIKSYFGFISNPDSTISKADLLEEIQQLKTKKMLVTYDHFDSLRAIMNEDQKANFEKFMNRVVPIISGSHRRSMRKSKSQ